MRKVQVDSDLTRFTLKNYGLEYFAQPIGSVGRYDGCFPNKLQKTIALPNNGKLN